MVEKMHNTSESIFSKVRKEHPDSVVWENEKYFVLKDIEPQAKTHLLVIPKKEVATLSEMPAAELGELMDTANQVAREFGIQAYQIQINVNKPYQDIFHVHVHLKSDVTE